MLTRGILDEKRLITGRVVSAGQAAWGCFPVLPCGGPQACLFAKRLEKGRFVWPPLTDGSFQMSVAQLALLIEGMDWRRTVMPEAPRVPVYA